MKEKVSDLKMLATPSKMTANALPRGNPMKAFFVLRMDIMVFPMCLLLLVTESSIDDDNLSLNFFELASRNDRRKRKKILLVYERKGEKNHF
jgi:hypothetical protein